MDRTNIIATVRRVLAEITQNKAALENDLDTSLKEELGIDSMTSLTFLMALEDNIEGFVVDANTLEAEHFQTIGSICGYVISQLERADTRTA
jgi:acyl carrier protein